MAYDHEQEVLDEFGGHDARLIDLAQALTNCVQHYHQANMEIKEPVPYRDKSYEQGWRRTRNAYKNNIDLILMQIKEEA